VDDKPNLHIRYVMFINIYIIFRYKYIYIYCSSFYSKNKKKMQMSTDFKHKNLYKLWVQRKGEHSNIKREYVSNSAIGMYRCFCF